MAVTEYSQAKKMAEKAAKSAISEGKYPYPTALDDFLKNDMIAGEEPLGVIDIPLSRIAGTKTTGRQNSFAHNFMPLLGEDTEFATKWQALYNSQLEEGIRIPIVAYEYMSRYYVQEGNKRVSVMKFVGGDTISASVIRIMPINKEDPEVKRYFEYLDFYNSTKLSLIFCDITDGGYEMLSNFYGKGIKDVWTDDEILQLKSDFNRFEKIYMAHDGFNLPMSTGDAFIIYLKVYGAKEIQYKSTHDLRNDVNRIWNEIRTVASGDKAVKLQLNPSENAKTGVLSGITQKVAGAVQKKRKIAFVYGKNPKDSAWTYMHDLGRAYIEDVYGDEIETTVYADADKAFSPTELLNKVVADGNNVIFATTPYLSAACLKVAVAHPDVKILNCATDSSASSIRTYYCRMYETKFLLGVIAGALSNDDNIGYIADYPIYSTIANINAFAIGAKMANPKVKVELTWSCLKDVSDPEEMFDDSIKLISGKDIIVPNKPGKDFGLYMRDTGSIKNIATTICDWGKFYQQIIDRIKNDSYKADLVANKNRAINYWWGLNAGVIELIYSDKLPREIARMVDVFTEAITWDRFSIFDTELKDNKGNLIQKSGEHMELEKIMKMNWLLDNVEGKIPGLEELKEESYPLVLLQGDTK